MIGRIEVRKTARYFATHLPKEAAGEIWFVLHGYGQSAERFHRKFDSIAGSERTIVAPEGLHRFYNEGFSGRVGASWMTKEDREEDINDYVRYLDDLLALYLEGRAQAPRIVVVGFSQGGATATRWVCQGNSNIDRLVLWAASFPQDLVFPNAAEALNKVGLTLVIGDEDEFISSDHVEDLISKLNQRSISHSLVNFSGGHTIETDVLKTIVG